MSHITAGAVLLGFDEETSEDTRTQFKTKTAFKAALKDQPAAVLITSTCFGLGPGKAEYRASELDPQFAYQVTGPDPETNRKWFARVEVKNGKPVVVA